MTAFLWINESRDPGLTVAWRVSAMLAKLGAGIASDIANADFIVVIGGDGTILQCAKQAAPLEIPIIGVNMGKIGFIAELEPSELDLLAKVVSGDYRLDNRMMLEVEIGGADGVTYSDIALNDAVISGDATARVVELKIAADGEQLTALTGDGVVVSTPTGSTGYAMSAGGPIVEPWTHTIAVTPICPHGLWARTFLLDHRREVRVESKRPGTLYLTVDGRDAVAFGEGQHVTVRRSERYCHFIRVKNRNFYQVISDKLGQL
ncbi:NAD kinase [Clostridia bacterium]|nr:NAD kinase [Clostridia bacterium]